MFETNSAAEDEYDEQAVLSSGGNGGDEPRRDGTTFRQIDKTSKGTMRLKKVPSFQKDQVDNEFQAFIMFQISQAELNSKIFKRLAKSKQSSNQVDETTSVYLGGNISSGTLKSKNLVSHSINNDGDMESEGSYSEAFK